MNNWTYLSHEKVFDAFKDINVNSMRFIPVGQGKLNGIILRQIRKGIIKPI